MNQTVKISREYLMRQRREVINDAVEYFMENKYNPEEKKWLIDYYCREGEIEDTDDDIWETIKAEDYIFGMYLFYTKVTEFNKELKELIKECRERFINDEIRFRNRVNEIEEREEQEKEKETDSD